ncbi:MAG: hypothetical protein WBL92_04015, partial [Methanothrix sp.]
ASLGRGRDLRAMLKGTGLRRVARIDTGLSFEKGFGEKVDGFAQEFGLERIDLWGNTAVAEKSYETAKSCLLADQTVRTPLPDRNLPLQSRWPKEPILFICQKAWKRITRLSSQQKE